jgi:Zn-dependent protease
LAARAEARSEHGATPSLEIEKEVCGVPGRSRTCNPLVRSQVLYPLSYGDFRSVPFTSNGTISEMDIAITAFELVVLLFSAILHEIAHGYEAERLGDPTARLAGRLTLNPIVHLDPFGSILMPILLYIASSGTFFFAAAKPVPYNPANLRNPRSGSARIAFAGPATNFLIALAFGIFMRIVSHFAVSDTFFALLGVIVYINILLGLFNLIPIPPLDGSRILFAALPPSEATYRAMYALEKWGLLLVLVFVFFGFGVLRPVVNVLFTLFTGQSFGI